MWESISFDGIPALDLNTFFATTKALLEKESTHCLNLYGNRVNGSGWLICIIADDEFPPEGKSGSIYVFKHLLSIRDRVEMPSLTPFFPEMHVFEREITENFGILFRDSAYPKPLRFAHDRANPDLTIDKYPFYQIESHELHEVGVGPIHAGVIEPGHFRFICNGEQVIHLEIQHGWQHRGVESLFLSKKKLIERTLIAENISGDSTIAHTLCFAQLMEQLAGIPVSKNLELERGIALELERIAVHVGDLSAMCTDVAYQLGSAAFGALRTPIINFLQSWCGNRFGKGMIRTGGSYYPLTKGLIKQLRSILVDFSLRFDRVASRTFSLPGIEKRFVGIGGITQTQARLIGAVGMTARMTGHSRDIRHSHPFSGFKYVALKPQLQETGDVWARAYLRKMEIDQSLKTIATMVKGHIPSDNRPLTQVSLKPNSFVCSVTEGWRGEICHSAFTDDNGQLVHYKIKDASLHNWKALELSLRNLEISDFPINNKSYDLSYSGFDL